jgi:ribosomal 50S subunit-associated protein YjgA (DUF615 family)
MFDKHIAQKRLVSFINNKLKTIDWDSFAAKQNLVKLKGKSSTKAQTLQKNYINKNILC